MKYKVTTESGSVYHIDTTWKTMVRHPGEDATELQGDSEPIYYAEIAELKVGEPVYAIWYRSAAHAHPTVRATTPIVSIEDIE